MFSLDDASDGSYPRGLVRWLFRRLEKEAMKDQGVALHVTEFFSPLQILTTLWIPFSVLVGIVLYLQIERINLSFILKSLGYGLAVT
jgi:hypothetical protein